MQKATEMPCNGRFTFWERQTNDGSLYFDVLHSISLRCAAIYHLSQQKQPHTMLLDTLWLPRNKIYHFNCRSKLTTNNSTSVPVSYPLRFQSTFPQNGPQQIWHSSKSHVLKVTKNYSHQKSFLLPAAPRGCCCNTFTNASHKHLTDAELHFTTISQAVLPTTPVYKLGFTVRL